MNRAERCFQAAGIEVVPAPCSMHAAWEWSFSQFVPDPYAVAGIQDAAHEAAGLIWYRLHGRIQ
jgi:uncharacterized SAM-binding protein YcdF (DUF218 family)